MSKQNPVRQQRADQPPARVQGVAMDHDEPLEKFPDNLPVWRKFIYDLESQIFYVLIGISCTVGLLVWGATKIGPRGGGLLKAYKPIFGTEYGLLMAAIMVFVLWSNRRWKALAVLAFSYVVMGFLQLRPKKEVPATWDEYFALGAMLSSLLIGMGLYYQWFDD